MTTEVEPNRCGQRGLHSDSRRETMASSVGGPVTAGHLPSKVWTGSSLYTHRDARWRLMQMKDVLSKHGTPQREHGNSLNTDLGCHFGFFFQIWCQKHKEQKQTSPRGTPPPQKASAQENTSQGR